MKDPETCLRYFNKLHYHPEMAKRIIARNIRAGPKPPELDLCYRFLSSTQLSNKVNKGHRIPAQVGDAGLYLINSEGEVLGIESFNINPLEDSIDIVQVKGNKAENLSRDARQAINVLPWEQALTDVVEGVAKWCEAGELRFRSATDIPEFYSLEPGRRHNLIIRYDVTAIERGFAPATPLSYRKALD